jgi:DNA-directed RNA polymerase subunit beta
VPESFKVLIKELQSLSLDIRVLSDENKEIVIKDVDYDVNEKEKAKELGLDLPEANLGGSSVAEVMQDDDIDGDVDDLEIETSDADADDDTDDSIV